MKEIMNKSSMRGILLSLVLIFTISVIPLQSVYAEEDIVVDSTSFENSTILNVQNKGVDEIFSFRVWLGSDYEFDSFKTESGWKGEKTPQGVIIFTSEEAVKENESVKFYLPFDNFRSRPAFSSVDDYLTYKEGVTTFITCRNRRINAYAHN